MNAGMIGLVLAGSALLAGPASRPATTQPGASRAATREEMAALRREFAAACPRILLVSRRLSLSSGIFEPAEREEEITYRPDPNVIPVGKNASRWWRYEDEYLSFFYPAASGQVVKVIDHGRPFTLTGGGQMGAVDNRCSRAYFVARPDDPNDPALVMMLFRTGDFDDGRCFCGQIVYEKYMIHHGAMYRFSLLDRGGVKKVQMLCRGLRLSFLEVTHLGIPLDLYTAVGLGVRMKNAPCDEGALRKMIADKYGLEGLLGFIEPGMTEDQLAALLGKPIERQADGPVFRSVLGRKQTTGVVPVKDGRFLLFKRFSVTDELLAPERGSVDWIEEITGSDDMFSMMMSKSYDLGPLKDEDVPYIFERFQELGPKVNAWDFHRLCEALVRLAESDKRDMRALTIIRKRIFEPRFAMSGPILALKYYEPDVPPWNRVMRPRSRQLLVRLAKKLVAETPADWKPKFQYEDFLGGLAVLLYIPSDDPALRELILTATRHPNAYVRYQGLKAAGSLPPKDALRVRKAALSDSSRRVRAAAAFLFTSLVDDDPDLPALLVERLTKEKDDYIRQNLRFALENIRERQNPPASQPAEE